MYFAYRSDFDSFMGAPVGANIQTYECNDLWLNLKDNLWEDIGM